MNLEKHLRAAESDTDHYTDAAIVAASTPADFRDFTIAVTDTLGELEFVVQVELMPTMVYNSAEFTDIVLSFEHADTQSSEKFDPGDPAVGTPALTGHEVAMLEAFLLIANFIQTDD